MTYLITDSVRQRHCYGDSRFVLMLNVTFLNEKQKTLSKAIYFQRIKILNKGPFKIRQVNSRFLLVIYVSFTILTH